MEATSFSPILKELIDALPLSIGAVFVDWEGEAVDVCSRIEDTQLQIYGAQWGIIFYQAKRTFEKHGMGDVSEMVMSFEHQHVILRRITEHYLLLLSLKPDENLGHALYLVGRAETKLRSAM